ncbi:GNAT family N-acetyltransferase [Actinopolymorpha alba]|uniref:GNAT family N-acetyltransferase n=1 Tax=Actinopolymorpha alba TaxID=533267 RepID=UPI000370C680|nr:GNAT family N-acetyltransferase [Actinopolymorpha alba]
MDSLLLRRPTLDTLPDLAIDVGVATSADLTELARVLDAAFAEDWDVDRVRRNLVDDPTVKGTYVVRDGDRIVATASARLLPEQYPDAGYLHWVAADPAVRGKGLGAAVTVAVLRDFVARGLACSVLETEDHRLAAITLYLGLGYIPQYRDPSHEARWSAIFTALADVARKRARP